MRKPKTWRQNDHLLRGTLDGIELIDTGSSISLPAPEEAVRAVHPQLKRLVGMDALRTGPLLVDWSDGVVRQDLTDDDWDAMRTPVHSAPLREVMGIPAIGFECVKVSPTYRAPNIALIDTGAPISYAPRAAVAGLRPVGEATDFMPLIGEFTTPLYQVTIRIMGATRRIRVGVLPPILDEALLMVASATWILGAEFLRDHRFIFDFPNNTLLELPRANWIQRLFDDRIDEVFCGNIHCTTCGGIPFWHAVRAAAAQERGVSAERIRRSTVNRMLLEAIPTLVRGTDSALIALLYRTEGWRAIPGFDDTWAGQVVRARAEIDARRSAERQQRAEDAEEAQRRKKERAIERAAAHQQRMAEQRERSARWHDARGRSDD